MFCALYCYYWLGKIETAMNMGKKGKIRFPGTSLKLAALFLWFVPALYVGISRTQVFLKFCFLTTFEKSHKS